LTVEITPPLKWHGGKHYLAKKIIALMPPHTHYVEPYFGGGSVMLAKDPEGVSEVANDINYELTNFWCALQSPEAFAELSRRLSCVPFSEVEWGSAAKELEQSKLRLDGMTGMAVSFYIRCRMSMSGRMKDFAPLSRTRTRRGMNEQASAWMNAVDGLPEVHARLRRVAILNRPALEVIRGQDGEQTLFYLDPPYLHETRATTSEYAHEMTHADHRELLGTLTGIKGKFLLSGYDSDLYREFERANGWRRHEFELPNNAAGGDTKRRMREIVWCNVDGIVQGEGKDESVILPREGK
jgi:DNA adenine methylase